MGQSVKPSSNNHNCRCHVRSEFRSLLRDPIWNKSHPKQWKGCGNLTSPWSSDRTDRGFLRRRLEWKCSSFRLMQTGYPQSLGNCNHWSCNSNSVTEWTDLQMFSNIYGAHNLLQVIRKLRLAKLLQEVYPLNHFTSSLFLLFKWFLWCPLILTEEKYFRPWKIK